MLTPNDSDNSGSKFCNMQDYYKRSSAWERKRGRNKSSRTSRLWLEHANDWWLQPTAVCSHTFSGVIWHCTKEINSIQLKMEVKLMMMMMMMMNCMTLSWCSIRKYQFTFTLHLERERSRFISDDILSDGSGQDTFEGCVLKIYLKLKKTVICPTRGWNTTEYLKLDFGICEAADDKTKLIFTNSLGLTENKPFAYFWCQRFLKNFGHFPKISPELILSKPR